MSVSFEPSRSACVIAFSVTLSFVLHASAWFLRGRSPAPERFAPPEVSEFAVEAERERLSSSAGASLPSSLSPGAAKLRAPALHRHSYPVPRGHDQVQHDPALSHSIDAAQATPRSDAPASQGSSAEPVRFVMRARATPSSFGPTLGHAGSEAPLNAPAEATPAVFAESAVDAPAKLLESAPLVYPDAARVSEQEADVTLELIVASDGRVVSARALSRPGSGFELEAERAVRRYRFSAALRAGRPVSVRMRWMVSFRLR